MSPRNNFDLLRLFAASIVIVGHSFAVLGRPQPVFLNNAIATYGVMIFFSISGYLISGSWLREPSIQRYLSKRALRIFPALVVVVLISVFVFGPIFSTLSAPQYFSRSGTYGYLRNFFLYIVYQLPGVFEHLPLPNVMNGSLWSLPAEFAMYLLTPILISLPARRMSMAIVAIAMAIVAVYLGSSYAGARPVFYGTEIKSVCAMGCLFAGGALVRLVREKFNINLLVAIALFAIYALLAIQADEYMRYVSAITGAFVIPYFVVAIGESSVLRLPNAGKLGDFSYGMYLYAFPFQQALVYYWGVKIGVTAEIFFAFALTIPFAVFSWHVVEKRALALKPTRSIAKSIAGSTSVQGIR